MVAVVAVVGAMVGVRLATGGPSAASAPPSTASASLVSTLSNVPAAAFAQAGRGDGRAPQALAGAEVTTKDGKPYVLYVGAEYCPFCAVERWPLTIALSRFGTWSGLKEAHSAPTDGNLPTVSYRGATYASDYLTFDGVELSTGQPSGTDATIDATVRPTAEQQRLLATYDAPPYTAQGGGIPFLYVGGRYLLHGSSIGDLRLLTSGDDVSRTAAQAVDPTTALGAATLASANTLTAAFCTLTGDRPAEVCTSAVVRTVQRELAAAR